ncbi:MAG: hypothetical protein CVT92_04365 [Bacteroidetes bacterium HGW-Bacteroidetes-1]|jgi:hypothetical protein|nr:MAG: hypothetical protein CVT92_04365 [Bacteroidetes bacterium HGW-Bacteroidetes-1]
MANDIAFSVQKNRTRFAPLFTIKMINHNDSSESGPVGIFDREYGAISTNKEDIISEWQEIACIMNTQKVVTSLAKNTIKPEIY